MNFRDYQLEVLDISECRWTDNFFVILWTTTYNLLWENWQSHTESVTILISHDTERSLISCEPINERILTARFQTIYLKLSIIQCEWGYRHPKWYVLWIIFIYYEQNTETQHCHCDTTKGSKITLAHGLENLNKTGRILKFYELLNLIITSTIFFHKNIHKVMEFTWQ